MFSFFKKKPVPAHSESFDKHVYQSIHLIGNADGSPDDKDLVELLSANQIPLSDAQEIVCFLPIAFVRRYLPSVKWPAFYFEVQKDNKLITKTFSRVLSFQRISAVVDAYFRTSPTKEEILKIAGRSAEFHVINNLLSQSPQYKPQDVKLTPSVITPFSLSHHE